MNRSEFMESRRKCMGHNYGVLSKLKEISSPLSHLNISDFGYGKYFLDDEQSSNKLYWLRTDTVSYDWFCENRMTIGTVFKDALRNTIDGEIGVLSMPVDSQDPIINAYRDRFNIKAAVTLYKRKKNSVEFWSFDSNQDQSILSSSIVNLETIKLLSNFTDYFEEQKRGINIDETVLFTFPEIVSLEERSPKQIDLHHFMSQLIDSNLQLSPQEVNCLILLSEGKTIKEIALNLKLSPHTIRGYLEKIKWKTGAHFKTDLIKLATKYQ